MTNALAPVLSAMLAALLALLLAAPPLRAQGAQIAFGGLKQDTSLPVEISADSLSVNQQDGTAVFSGNVIVGQGEMRLAAGEIRVAYGADGKTIETLFATGGVTIANATDAAEAREAVYQVTTGEVVMSGDVLLTQGQNAITGQKLRLNLKSGTGVMEGRVTTTFVPDQKATP